MMNEELHDASHPDSRFPTILGALGWVVVFLLLQIVAGVLALGIAIGMDESGRDAMALARDVSFIAAPTILSLVASSLVLLGLFWLHLGKENRAARIGLMRWSRLSLMQTVGLAIGLIALGLAFNHVYANYVIPDIKVQEALRKMFAALPDTPLNAVMLFVAIAGIAPLLEEILFRGLVQNALAKRLPAWGAILGASAIFGAVHMDYHAFPALMAMGAVFGILYHKTGSLRVNILAHALNNAAALLLT
ncbi:MAG: CPBP family intramembrane metalloprotease [Sphingomonadales bacterium]|jgi:membrane protease YdiL (CAAX protease family)|nr:CPBP family intramembrane metalloprotease [Sphingomonadales bacterium]MBK9267501.1 CPBP family intramembrane metalloprotease [Sphingomonadales bacterium]